MNNVPAIITFDDRPCHGTDFVFWILGLPTKYIIITFEVTLCIYALKCEQVFKQTLREYIIIIKKIPKSIRKYREKTLSHDL